MTRPLIVACAAVLLIITSAAAQHTLGQNNISAVARSIALFRKAGKVFQSPRCLNCHPMGERPTQLDRMVPHQPLVVRGIDGHGAPGLACDTCHHAANYDAAGVPGNPGWRLAPASMGWQGRPLGEICEQIKDGPGRQVVNALLRPAPRGSLAHSCEPGPPAERTARRTTASSNGIAEKEDRPRTPVCRRHSHLRAS